MVALDVHIFWLALRVFRLSTAFHIQRYHLVPPILPFIQSWPRR